MTIMTTMTLLLAWLISNVLFVAWRIRVAIRKDSDSDWEAMRRLVLK